MTNNNNFPFTVSSFDDVEVANQPLLGFVPIQRKTMKAVALIMTKDCTSEGAMNGCTCA